MKIETKVLGIILLITIVLIFFAVFFLGKNTSTYKSIEETKVSQIDYSKGQKIGSDSAKVRLTEFSDFQCPACAVAETAVEQIRTSFSDQVQVIYRHFPLPQHAYSRKAAYLAEAAGQQNKFWEMHNKLFSTQSQWSSMSESDAQAFFLSLVKDLGLNEDKVGLSLTGDIFKEKIDADIAEGKQLGIDSTPTFFLNGHKLNLQSFADLNTAISEELKK